MKQNVVFLILPLLLCCFCAPRAELKTAPLPENSVEAREIVDMQSVREAGDIYQGGIASWYGKKFHGRRTANGEIYDMYKLTAAHKKLPFNTFVEVENLLDGKRIVVRINDRGPFVKGRIIDLSYRAAQRAGFAERGTAPVRLRIVKPGAKTAVKTVVTGGPAAGDEAGSPVTNDGVEKKGECYIQAGAFSSSSNARRMVKRIRKILPGVFFAVYFRDGLYKVISEDFLRRAEAEEHKEKLERYGITVFIKGGRPPSR